MRYDLIESSYESMLGFGYLFLPFRIKAVELPRSLGKILRRKLKHTQKSRPCHRIRKRGCGKKALVEYRIPGEPTCPRRLAGVRMRLFCFLFLLAVRDRQHGKLYEQTRERQQYQRRKDIEGCVHHRYRKRVGRRAEVCRKNPGKAQKPRGGKRRTRADKIEIKVDERRAARVFSRPETGQQCGDAGADVLTEDYRQCRAARQHSRGGKRLKNADRCRGRLYYRRQ